MVAVSICDFTLWPDAERDAARQPRVPRVSRWRMTEQASGARSLGQVPYVFMELPKLGAHVTDTHNERWAALFASAPDLTPEGMAAVPLSEAKREARELAACADVAQLDAWFSRAITAATLAAVFDA